MKVSTFTQQPRRLLGEQLQKCSKRLRALQARFHLIRWALTFGGIWVLGPYGQWAGFQPLVEPMNRMVALWIAAMCWGLWDAVRALKKRSEPLHQLAQQAQEAWSIVGSMGHKLWRWQRPCYWVVGSSLARLEAFSRHTALQTLKKSLSQTLSTQWWLDQQTMVITTTPRLSAQSNAIEQTQHWQGLLRMWRYLRWRRPAQRVYLQVTLEDLLRPDQSNRSRLIRTLETMAQAQKDLDVALVITDAGLLDGFLSFINHCSPSEKQSPWAIDLGRRRGTELLAHYDKAFDQCIRHLNQRMIRALHHHHNMQRRREMLQLVEALWALKQPLLQCLMECSQHQGIRLQKVYWSHTPTQEHEPEAFSQHCLRDTWTSKPRWHEHYELIPTWLYPAAMSLLMSGLLWWGADQFQSWHQWQQTMTLEVAQTPQLNFHNLNDARQSLIHLNHHADKLMAMNAKSHLAWLSPYRMMQWALLKRRDQLLEHYWLPKLMAQLASDLKNTRLTLTDRALALSAYESLGQGRVTTALSQWMIQRHPQRPMHEHRALSALLKHYFQRHTGHPKHSLTRQWAAHMRAKLRALPLSEQALMMLHSHDTVQADGLLGRLPALPDQPPLLTVFTRAAWHQTLHKRLPQLCEQLALEHHGGLKTCLQQSRRAYAQAYLQYWYQQLNARRLPLPQHLDDLVTTLHTLKTDEPLLVHFLRAVRTQIQPIKPWVARLSPSAQQQWRYLDTSTSPTQTSSFEQWLERTLVAYRAQEAQRRDVFDDMQSTTGLWHQATTEPPQDAGPWLNAWISTIQQGLQAPMVMTARQQINTIWQQTLQPVYQAHLAHHYPFDDQATQDADLSIFERFFQPGGLVDTFTQHYLAPFGHWAGSQWVWQPAFQSHPLISSEAMNFFKQARLIRMAFFNRSHHAQVSAQLEALPLSTDVTQWDLIADGQPIHMDRTPHLKPQLIQWPMATHGDPTATLVVTDRSGQKHMISEHGPWSLMRLFDHAHIDLTSDSYRYRVRWSLDHQQILANLTIDAPVSPWVHPLFRHMHLPHEGLTGHVDATP